MPPKRLTKALGRTADDFENLKPHEHILVAPDMYIGSTRQKTIEEWVYDPISKKMKQIKMDLPAGVKRVFLEILTNAGDNSYYSASKGVNPGVLKINFSEDHYISITNGGLPLPVEPHKNTTKDNLYLLPTDTFGVVLSSTNYNKDVERYGCGRNGYGAKLTNIYSQHFIVNVGDSGRIDSNGNPISGQEFFGEWSNNMYDIVKSEAKPGFVFRDNIWDRKKTGEYKGKSYVKVEWLLDFDRFGMKEGYSSDDIALFTRYAIEVSLTCQIPVEINGVRYDFRSIREYASLFWDEPTVKTAISHFNWGKGVNPPKKFLDAKTSAKRENLISENSDISFDVETQILLLDTPDNAHIFSYANGMNTLEGGIHVDQVLKKISTRVISEFKGKMTSEKKITLGDIKPHISMIVVCRVPNPEWNSQSKTKMDNPKPFLEFDDKIYTTILSSSWSLMERLSNTLDAKMLKSLSKTDGKKKQFISLEKGEDANWAGGPKSSECVLFLVEGESASSYPKSRIQMLPGKKDIYGYYPLKGKPMNVSSNTPTDVSENEQFANIKKILGIQELVDYSDPKNFKELRYGSVIVTTDADTDGAHIFGLVLNLFHRRWPTLLKNGFIKQLITPIVRVYPKGSGRPLRFYDERVFDKWMEDNSKTFSKSYQGIPRYFKGLGTSDDNDIKDDLDTAPIVKCIYDNEAYNNIELAFNPKFADLRKRWISNWMEISSKAPVFSPKTINVNRDISDIINYSLTPYTIDNLYRSIPSYKDGLKKSQRQILYFVLHHWNYGHSNMEKPFKVERVANRAADFSHYHHGEQSLSDAIISLAQSFIGSNNLPVLQNRSQIGTRDKGGKDAPAPRYAEISASWWVPYVYQKEMVELVPRRNVEGEDAEPHWLPCDIPIGIINGCKGIATGWSTYLPNHHPIDVIDWILDTLEMKKPAPLMPFFRDFQGSLEIKNYDGASLKSEEELEKEFEDQDDDLMKSQRLKGRSIITSGTYSIVNEYVSKEGDNVVDVKITEIPVGRWNFNYRKWVENLVKENKVKGFEDNGNLVQPNLLIKGMPKSMVSLTRLGLIKSYGMANLVLIDDDGIPKPYKTVECVLHRYIEDMLDIYEELKKVRLRGLKESLTKLQEELKIIKAVVNKDIIVINIDESIIHEALRERSFSVEIYEKLPVKSFNKTNIQNLETKIKKSEKEYDDYAQVPSHRLWWDRLQKFRSALIKRGYSEPLLPETSKIVSINGHDSYFTSFVSSIP